MQKIYRQLVEFAEKGERCALATLVSTSGSSPQNTGAKLIVLPDGRLIGTVGGGCMEAETRRIALDCLRKDSPRLFELRLDDDFGWDDGLICGGRVTIFVDPHPERSVEAYRAALQAASRREKITLRTTIASDNPEEIGSTEVVTDESAADSTRRYYLEPILPRPTALIAGAGHIGQALAQVLALCGFETVVVDDRPSFANADRFPFADRVEVAEVAAFVRDYPIDDCTYVAIVTRGHRNDAHVLRECVRSNAKYIGMIGSKRKIHVIFEELLREGLATAEELRRVRSPMGLTLNDSEVGEIAVSIAAEMIAVRNGADPAAIRPMQYTPSFIKSD
jgi:xanthine dehydrogenase accessory factor